MNNIVIANYTAGAIRTRLNALMFFINAAFAKHYKATYQHLDTPMVAVDGNGKRYIRVSIFRTDDVTRPERVFFFVDTTNGNLLRPASYKAPDTKNPRGCVFDKDILTKMTPYGVVYVRGPKVGDDLQSILGYAEV